MNWNEELLKAVNKGDLTGLRKAIEEKADVNAISKDNHNTALHLAAIRENVEIIEELLKVGVLVNAVNKDNNTPLHIATSMDSTEVSLALIRAGANVNAVNKYNSTPLHYSAISENFEVSLALLRAGANAEIVSNGGVIPSKEFISNIKNHIVDGKSLESYHKDKKNPVVGIVLKHHYGINSASNQNIEKKLQEKELDEMISPINQNREKKNE